MRWTILRRASAALIALAAIACAIVLPLDWHTVRAKTVTSPDLAAAAFYVGPDYHVSGEDRAAMLDRAYTQTPWVCDGLTHLELGTWPIVVALGAFFFALVAAAWPARRSALAVALVCTAAAGTASFVAAGAFFVRHLLEPIEAERLPADIFVFGLGLGTLSALVLFIAATAELVTLQRKGR